MIVIALTACAPQLNRQQEIVWDAYKSCQPEGPSTRLERVTVQGGWHIVGREGEVYKVNTCMTKYRREARLASRTTPTGPALTETTAKELIRFAYLTNEPPKDGTSLRDGVLGNMPPRRSEFPSGTPVTFVFALENTNSFFNGQIVWIDPAGAVVRRDRRSLDQDGRTGEWVWWTDTLPAFAGMEPGAWNVDLVLNGVSAGRYPFVLKPGP